MARLDPTVVNGLIVFVNAAQPIGAAVGHENGLPVRADGDLRRTHEVAVVVVRELREVRGPCRRCRARWIVWPPASGRPLPTVNGPSIDGEAVGPELAARRRRHGETGCAVTDARARADRHRGWHLALGVGIVRLRWSRSAEDDGVEDFQNVRGRSTMPVPKPTSPLPSTEIAALIVFAVIAGQRAAGRQQVVLTGTCRSGQRRRRRPWRSRCCCPNSGRSHQCSDCDRRPNR